MIIYCRTRTVRKYLYARMCGTTLLHSVLIASAVVWLGGVLAAQQAFTGNHRLHTCEAHSGAERGNEHEFSPALQPGNEKTICQKVFSKDAAFGVPLEAGRTDGSRVYWIV